MEANTNSPNFLTKTGAATKNSDQTNDGTLSNQVTLSAQSKAGLGQPAARVQSMDMVEPCSMVGGPPKGKPRLSSRPPSASCSREQAGTVPQKASPHLSSNTSVEDPLPPPLPLSPVQEGGVDHAHEKGAGIGLEEGAGEENEVGAGPSPEGAGHARAPSPALGLGLYANREARAKAIAGNVKARLQLIEYKNLKRKAEQDARRAAKEAEAARLKKIQDEANDMTDMLSDEMLDEDMLEDADGSM